MSIKFGDDSVTCGWFGDQKISSAQFFEYLVCESVTNKYRIQAFKSTGRRLGTSPACQFYSATFKNSSGKNYMTPWRHTLANHLHEWMDYVVTGIPTVISWCQEMPQAGAHERSVEEFDLYNIQKDGSEKYMGTGHFSPWTSNGTKTCTWSRINEHKPETASVNFLMEVYSAKSYESGTTKLFFPKMSIRSTTHEALHFVGDDANSSPQDAGSSVNIMFDGSPSTNYNSVNSKKPIYFAFKVREGIPKTIGLIQIMSSQIGYYEQMPCVFRIYATDANYKPVAQVALVKNYPMNKNFTYWEFNTKVDPAILTKEYTF